MYIYNFLLLLFFVFVLKTEYSATMYRIHIACTVHAPGQPLARQQGITRRIIVCVFTYRSNKIKKKKNSTRLYDLHVLIRCLFIKLSFKICARNGFTALDEKMSKKKNIRVP